MASSVNATRCSSAMQLGYKQFATEMRHGLTHANLLSKIGHSAEQSHLRLLLFLCNVAVILGLITFNYFTLTKATHLIANIETLSQLLDARGRQRYEVQAHFTAWLTREDAYDKRVTEFQSSELFAAIDYDTVMARSPALKAWPQRAELDEKRLYLEHQKSRFFHITFDAHDDTESLAHIEGWSIAMVNILHDIQGLEVLLSRYLTEQVTKVLQLTLYTNVFTLLGLFTISLAIMREHQRQNTRNVKHANQDLIERQDELQHSKKLLVCLMEDLSQEKDSATALSQELQFANNAMKQKNDEMEQFIYTVSHDLKSPLVTISAFAKKLGDELPAHVTEKQGHRLQRIQDNVRHMERLLGDLLQLSRVVRENVDKTQVDVKTLIQTQCTVMESLVQETEASIVIRTPIHTIVANERLLSQCLQNLLSNAIHYREKTRALLVEVFTKKTRNHTCLIVKDNGIGIEEKYQERIFGIFERLGPGEGTGVGLTIVKTIMEKHGGELTLVSHPNVGSEFTLHFPDGIDKKGNI